MIHINVNCQAYHLLSILAVVGEYPLRQLHLLGNPRMYRDTIRRMCQEQEYINDETKEKITTKVLTITGKGFQRSVRLLQGAEALLQWMGAKEYYGEAYGQYNFSGGEKHRLRNFRIAGTIALCKMAGYEYRPYGLPLLRFPKWNGYYWEKEDKKVKRFSDYPCMYPVRELKGGGNEELKKTVFTRITGAIFTGGQVYPLYNLGNEMQKLWENSEIKMKRILSELNLVNGGEWNAYSCVFLTNDGMIAIKTLRYIYNKRKNKKKDHSGTEFYSSVHWIPLTEEGARQLRFFSIPYWTRKIEKVLFANATTYFNVSYGYWLEDMYQHSFLSGDIAQLICFKKTVLKTEEPFLIYCFPHQVSFLKTFFGDRVALRVIKLEQIENLLKVDEYFDD